VLEAAALPFVPVPGAEVNAGVLLLEERDEKDMDVEGRLELWSDKACILGGEYL